MLAVVFFGKSLKIMFVMMNHPKNYASTISTQNIDINRANAIRVIVLNKIGNGEEMGMLKFWMDKGP